LANDQRPKLEFDGFILDARSENSRNQFIFKFQHCAHAAKRGSIGNRDFNVKLSHIVWCKLFGRCYTVWDFGNKKEKALRAK